MKKEDLFEKCCINQYHAMDLRGKVILYKRKDLYNWAKEAASRGEKYFYCRPVDENDRYGELELCKPEYRWFIKDKNGLSEETYNKLNMED